MDDEQQPHGDTEGQERGLSAWLQRRSDLVWFALAIVFVIYGATALVNLTRGTLGPDDSNIISTFGGFIAGIAALIIGIRTARDHRRD
jgi:hypothetical protein